MSYLGLCSYFLVYLEVTYLIKANARHVVTRSLLKTTMSRTGLETPFHLDFQTEELINSLLKPHTVSADLITAHYDGSVQIDGRLTCRKSSEFFMHLVPFLEVI